MKFIKVFLCVLFIPLISYGQLKKSKKFPDINLLDKENIVFSTKGFEGNNSLILLFDQSNMCKPCKNALDSIALNNNHLINELKLTIIAISITHSPFPMSDDDGFSEIFGEPDIIKCSDYPYVHFYWDEQQRLINKYKIESWPQFFILDKEMNIVESSIGSDGLEQLVKQAGLHLK